MLDRTLTPEFGAIDKIELQQPEKTALSNGIPIFLLEAGTQDVLKIEIWSRSGSIYGSEGPVAEATSTLMSEGTSSRTAEEIANSFDQYGAHFESNSDKENCKVALYTLGQFLEPTLKSFADVVLNPTFPESEVKVYADKRKQQIELSLEQVGTLASRAFTENLFGKGHPYGKAVQPENLQNLTSAQLTAHHQNKFLPSVQRIICAGKMPTSLMSDLEAAFGGIEIQNSENLKTEFPDSISDRCIRIEKKGAVQNAIKIGRPMFNRLHPDYVGMQILSTALGGYFGSRLMSNIREDKGYTYGIGSSLQSFQESGYFVISTEVGSDVCEAALKEIYSELERLRTEPISEDEMGLVKNYIMGAQLKSVDGPFSLSSKWNGLINFGLTESDYQAFIQEILDITPERLQTLAKTYLEKEMLMEVVAGKI
ncbi:MAG: zinc protease [Flavobacteriales bacterium]|jgi:zinc protease